MSRRECQDLKRLQNRCALPETIAIIPIATHHCLQVWALLRLQCNLRESLRSSCQFGSNAGRLLNRFDFVPGERYRYEGLGSGESVDNWKSDGYSYGRNSGFLSHSRDNLLCLE
jgi:hypothetical protein